LTQRLDGAIDTLEGEIVARFPEARSLFGAPETRYARLNAFVQEQLSHLPDLLSHMASVMLAVFLVPLFSFFLLRDSRRMIRLLMDHLPPRHVETSVAVWCEIDRIMGRYLRGLAIDGLIVGTTVATGLWILGVNYPLLLGAISGMANVIPYVGPVICEVTIIVIVVLQFHSLGPVLNILAFYLCLKFCDMTLIHPMSVGKAVHLHPVLLIASVLVGGHAFGLIGMIVAVPTVTIVQEVARLLLERRRPRSLAGGRPEENIFVQPIVC
jgi:predicted PurR-regulated permease PerM